MNIFHTKLKRKEWIISYLIIFLVVVFINMLAKSPSDNENTLALILLVIVILANIILIHFRCNDINGHIKIKNTILYVILSFIPIIGFASAIYLSCAKSNCNFQSKPNNKFINEHITRLQTKYIQNLIINNDIIDNNISRELYQICIATPNLNNIITSKNISANDFIILYKIMKSDDVLWDDETGAFLPFVALLNQQSLLLLIENINIPPQKAKKLVLNLLSSNDSINNASLNKFSFLFRDIKKLWILIFFVISIGMMLYPPYHTILPKNGDEFAGYSFIGTIPSQVPSSRIKYTSVDYTTLTFHEVILLVICAAGYTVTTMVKK